MLFSKSFSYTLRTIIFLSSKENYGKNIMSEEISTALNLPPYYASKLLLKLTREKILLSSKGPNGGFKLNPTTKNMSLYEVLLITENENPFYNCILKFENCNPSKPCLVHNIFSESKNLLEKTLKLTKIDELKKMRSEELIPLIK